MSNKKNTDQITAADLMAGLNRDPDFVRRSQEKTEDFSVRSNYLAAAERPVVTALIDSGIAVNSVSDLVNSRQRYPRAIPVLIDHLVLPYPYPVREAIARALTTRDSGHAGYEVLVEEFRKLADSENDPALHGFKWALGNAISVVADTDNFDEVANLVRDKRHGTTRDMMVLRLPRLEPHRAVAVLIELLADDEVAGHAITALAKLKAGEARGEIERLLKHPQPWVRKEAVKYFAKLGEDAGKSGSGRPKLQTLEQRNSRNTASKGKKRYN
jgi:HEAT repeat protein